MHVNICFTLFRIFAIHQWSLPMNYPRGCYQFQLRLSREKYIKTIDYINIMPVVGPSGSTLVLFRCGMNMPLWIIDNTILCISILVYYASGICKDRNLFQSQFWDNNSLGMFKSTTGTIIWRCMCAVSKKHVDERNGNTFTWLQKAACLNFSKLRLN